VLASLKYDGLHLISICVYGCIIQFFYAIFFLQNESINGHYKNASFMCADVTSEDLVLPASSIDLIFSNWLLMYLSDEEVMDETCFE